MSISLETRLHVRQRAGYSCEYCGVTETHSAGELTIDHFRPIVHAGTDEPDNLICCCVRCNLHKSDYWPESTDDLMLWHPCQETRETHFFECADGKLSPITSKGDFSIRVLRLNRSQLIEYRRLLREVNAEKAQKAQLSRLLESIRDVVNQENVERTEQGHILEKRFATIRALFRQPD